TFCKSDGNSCRSRPPLAPDKAGKLLVKTAAQTWPSGGGTLPQQLHHFGLDKLEIIQPQLGIFYDKDVAIFVVFIDQYATAVIFFRSNLLENAFPVEYH